MDLINHIQNNHNSVYNLHKNVEDSSLNFRIEYIRCEDVAQQKKQKNVVIRQATIVKDESRLASIQSLRSRRRRSWVWKYFEKMSDVFYRCNVCAVILSIKGFNTNNMNRHVKSKHPDIYELEICEKGGDNQEIGSEVEVNSEKRSVEVVKSSGNTVKTTVEEDAHQKNRRSWIWNYFEVMSDSLAKCQVCNRIICHGGSATGNMNRHMKMIHNDVYLTYSSGLTTKETVEVKNEEGSNDDDTSWIWKLFSTDDENFYSCKVCQYNCMKFADFTKSTECILEHLRSKHQIISAKQIVMADNIEEECSSAADYLATEINC